MYGFEVFSVLFDQGDPESVLPVRPPGLNIARLRLIRRLFLYFDRLDFFTKYTLDRVVFSSTLGFHDGSILIVSCHRFLVIKLTLFFRQIVAVVFESNFGQLTLLDKLFYGLVLLSADDLLIGSDSFIYHILTNLEPRLLLIPIVIVFLNPMHPEGQHFLERLRRLHLDWLSRDLMQPSIIHIWLLLKNFQVRL